MGSVVDFVASAVVGLYYAQVAGPFNEAAAAIDAAGNDTNSSLDLHPSVVTQLQIIHSPICAIQQRGADAAALVQGLHCHWVIECEWLSVALQSLSLRVR